MLTRLREQHRHHDLATVLLDRLVLVSGWGVSVFSKVRLSEDSGF